MRKSTLSSLRILNSISVSLKYSFIGLRLILLLSSTLLFSSSIYSATKYVSQNGSGTKNGTSWSNALDGSNSLKTIIESAVSGDNIYISGGIYYIPTTISWKTSVNIYGGFNSISPEANVTSRQIGVSPQFPWVFPSSSITVFSGMSTLRGRVISQTCGTIGVLDGITFENGQSGDNVGGAVYIEKGKVINSIIKNSYSNNGGGIYVGPQAELISSLVINNVTNTNGLKCTYDGGGGVYIDCGGKITNCYVVNNRSFNNGGGIFFNRGGVATNCVISNNYASSGGGAFIEYEGTLINCTVTNNAVPNGTSIRGKGVYYNVENYASRVNVKNCVIWNNSGYGNECATNGTAGTISNCAGSFKPAANATCISLSTSNTSGTNPPKFVNPTATQGYITNLTSSSIGDWSISEGSALVNRGADSYNSLPYDIIGNSRKYGTIDIGAYELGTIPVSSISITGNVHTYDTTPKSVSVAVTPTNVTNYLIEYKQGSGSYSTTKPINVGVYDVRVTITQPGFSGVQTGTLTINKANITGLTFGSASHVFDNTLKTVTLTGTIPAGVTVSYTNNSHVIVGTYPAVATINGGTNYNNSTANANLVITPKPVVITIAPISKFYGEVDPLPIYTTNVAVANFGGQFTGSLARGEGELVGNYAYSIGTLSLGANFSVILNQCSLEIKPRPINVLVSSVSKPYDRTLNSVIPTLSIQKGSEPYQVLESDFNQVSVSASAAQYETKEVGTNKVVIVSGITLTGLKASNYSVSSSARNSESSITPVPLSVTGLTVNSKIYDGTNQATLSGTPVLNGVLSGDAVQLVNSSLNQFTASNAAPHIIVTTLFLISGVDANNYILIQPQLAGAINPAILTVTFPSVSKIYDGNVSINPIPQLTVSGVKNNEIVTASASLAEFNSKEVGTGKIVTLTGISFSAPISSNYTLLNTASNNLGVITPREITVQNAISFPSLTKVYDGNVSVPTIASSSFRISGLLVGDQVQVVSYGKASFDNKNVGDNKIVSVSSIVYGGLDYTNYILPKVATNSDCSITKRSIVDDSNIRVTFASQAKVFDGTVKVLPDSIETPILINGLVSGDIVTGRASSAFYDNENVGINKTVTLDGIVYTGKDAINYQLPLTIRNTESSISPLTISNLPNFRVSIADQTKVYDGTTLVKPVAIPAITISGLLPGSIVEAVGSAASYDNKNVGVNKVVTVTNVVYSGKDANNYILPSVVKNYSSSISKRSINDDSNLIVVFDSQSKVFDGTTNVLPNGVNTKINIYGLITNDEVFASAKSAYYDNFNVGVDKTVTLGEIIYSGKDAMNYDLPLSVYNSDCSISPLDISLLPNAKIFINDQTKVYDGTTDVKPKAIPDVHITGLLMGSQVTAYGTSAYYDNKNVGVNKIVTVRGLNFSGKDAQNYIFPDSVRNMNSVITKRKPSDDSSLYLAFSDQTKMFDGTTKVLPDSTNTQININGLISGDHVVAKASFAAYDNVNVGNSKIVTLDGINYSGIDALNYELPTSVINNNSSITPFDIEDHSNVRLFIDVQTKVYDGTTDVKPNSIPQVKISGLLPGSEVFANGTSASYDNKNVGSNKIVTVRGIVFSGKDALNYNLPDSVRNILCSITKRSTSHGVSVSFDAQTKIFDGTTKVLPDSSATAINFNGIISGDIIYAKATSASYDNENVGVNKTVTLDGIVYSGIDAGNYQLPYTLVNNLSEITPCSISLLPNFKMSIDDQNKVYDGTTVVKPISVPSVTISGLLPGSIVTAKGTTAAYDNKNVGFDKTVTVTDIVFTGKDAANYILPNFVKNSTSSITKLSVSNDLVVSFDPQTKVFDGTTKVLPDSSATSILIDGLVSGDKVFGNATKAFYDNENVGTGKVVTLDNIIYSGVDAGNYDLPVTIINNQSVITPLSVTVLPKFKMIIDDQTKVYDGTTIVKPIAIPEITISGLLPGSIVHATGSSASYDNKNAGINKVVTVRDVLFSGKDAQNYIFPTSVINENSSITKLDDTIKKDLVVFFNPQSKVFDGTTKVLPDSTRTPILFGGLIAGDIVNATPSSAYYDNKNAGVNKTVTLSGIIYSGADAGNYKFPDMIVNNQSAITPLSVTYLPEFKMKILNQSKVYDGTTTVKPVSVPNILISGLLVGSEIQAVGTSASYDNKNVGTNKIVTVRDIIFLGKDSANYIIPDSVCNTSSSIVKRSINDIVLEFNSQTKVFDGTTKVLPDSTNTPIVINGLIPGDVVIAHASSANYDNPNVGTNKTIMLDGIFYSGPDAGNYQLPISVLNNKSEVTPLNVINLRDFKMTIANQTKVYDGTRVVKPIAIPAITITGLLSGSVVKATGSSATYDTKNVGVNKIVTVKGVQFSGKDALNYILPDSVINSSSSITKRTIAQGMTVSFAPQTKVFDGTIKVLPDSTKTPINIGGLIMGDVVNAAITTAAYDNVNVGINKVVTLSGIIYKGVDAGNYQLPLSVVNTQCTITPLDVSSLRDFKVAIADQEKVYDGTTSLKPDAVPVISMTGLLPGSIVNVIGTSASYDNKNVGTNKVVTVSGLHFTGKDALNYKFPICVVNSSSTITKLSDGIELSFGAQTKVYDRTTDVLNSDNIAYVPILSVSGILPGDLVSAQGSRASYESPSVGFNKTITISDIHYSGIDFNNYELPSTFFSSEHSIMPLQLKKLVFQNANISKIYDGTREVPVMPSVEAEGILPGEELILRFTSALFNDANVGRNKSAFVTLEAIGRDASNYSFDNSALLSNCEILPYPVTIKPVVGQKRAYEDSEGVLEYQRVILPVMGDPLNGFLTRDPGSDPGKYVIRIGELNQINTNYHVVLDDEVVFYEITTDLIVNKKYGNSLYAYNGEDKFVSYQWFKDNVPIPGAINQYYKSADNSLCGEFFCEAIKTNGARVRSYRLNETVDCNGVKKYSIHPTLVDLNGSVTIRVDSETNEYVFDNIIDSQVYTVQIYSMSGDIVLEYILDSIENAIVKAPNNSGIYIVKVLQEEEVVLTQKITVK